MLQAERLHPSCFILASKAFCGLELRPERRELAYADPPPAAALLRRRGGRFRPAGAGVCGSAAALHLAPRALGRPQLLVLHPFLRPPLRADDALSRRRSRHSAGPPSAHGMVRKPAPRPPGARDD